MPLDKRVFIICFLICLILAIFGFFIGSMAEIPRALLPEAVRPDVSVLAKLRVASTFKTILINNSRVFLMMIVGILTCGLLSVFEVLLIGAMVGFISKLAAQQGIGLTIVGAALAPHGILELTSFLLVAAIGIYFAVRIYRSSKGEAISWPKEARGYFVIIAGAYGLLVVAAVLETYLTPLVVSKYVIR